MSIFKWMHHKKTNKAICFLRFIYEALQNILDLNQCQQTLLRSSVLCSDHSAVKTSVDDTV